MTTKTHISVQNLSISYGEHKALNNISIDIPDKQITMIIGPSGCGKTTLLKSFNRLIDQDESVKVDGKVLIDDENIYDDKQEIIHLRKKVGLLAQRPYTLPMSIFDNVAYGPRLHQQLPKKELADLVEYYLREANLWDEVKDRLPAPANCLSIGQQQRLCLARGLAVEPEVILGDEPTSALDPVSSELIEQKFIELKKKYTIVLVTHSLRQAKRLADHGVFLYLGNLIEHGPAEIFFNKPRYAKTKAYIQGQFIPEFKPEATYPIAATNEAELISELHLAIAKMKPSQVNKFIIHTETDINKISDQITIGAILEVRRIGHNSFELIIQKCENNFNI